VAQRCAHARHRGPGNGRLARHEGLRRRGPRAAAAVMDATFSADAYLDRIGLAAPPRVTADGLESVHRAQAYTVPFENFDILLGRGISLDPAEVFAKLVTRRRG